MKFAQISSTSIIILDNFLFNYQMLVLHYMASLLQIRIGGVSSCERISYIGSSLQTSPVDRACI